MGDSASLRSDAARNTRSLSPALSVISLSIGALTRLIYLTSEAGRIHADEAVAGLMARSLLKGDWSTFF